MPPRTQCITIFRNQTRRYFFAVWIDLCFVEVVAKLPKSWYSQRRFLDWTRRLNRVTKCLKSDCFRIQTQHQVGIHLRQLHELRQTAAYDHSIF
jgi:hypothetical protein